MRNDDFAAIEQFRVAPPAPVRKAVRVWTGNMKFAVGNEKQAGEVADCLAHSITNSAAWSVTHIAVSDNIVTCTGLRYQARSANAHDAEQLATRCILSQGADLLSPIAVQTVDSVKLSAGR